MTTLTKLLVPALLAVIVGLLVIVVLALTQRQAPTDSNTTWSNTSVFAMGTPTPIPVNPEDQRLDRRGIK